MNKVIVPGKIQPAEIVLPSSKSLSHRALITASLAHGDSLIHGLAENNDTKATMRVMEKAGASFEAQGNDLIVHGMREMDYDGSLLDCGESGSTLRFLIPLFSLSHQEAVFTGHGKLMERPQNVYEDIYQKQGRLFEIKDGMLHLRGPLQSGQYILRGDVSSQFISGLLFALPLLKGDSTIEVLPPFESSSYVGLTLDALKRSGIVVHQEGLVYTIPGSQTYHPIDCTVEGDDSQMAFFAEEALIQNTPVQVLNVRHDSKQGDHVIVEIVKKLGGEVQEIPDGYRFTGNTLHGTTVDLADCPDLGPALFALATQCEGTTTFINAGRLRMKESDRIACMEEELRKMDCDISSVQGTVTVHGPAKIRGGVTVQGHNDHRIVMALAVLASIADGPVVIEGSEAVNKSYPEFFTDLAKTGVCIHDK
jgi:3-phosphoshikimate 1-carboxyvinyltransferase